MECVLCDHRRAPSTGCECNNHAQRCHFDQAVYEASGWTSGGVCDDCSHHTVGPRCDQCAPGYQPNPRSRMDRPDACIRKDLFDLHATHCPLGKLKNLVIQTEHQVVLLLCVGLAGCICSPEGTENGGRCDDATGSCQCKANVEGPRCDRCKRGYFGLSASKPLGCSGEFSHFHLHEEHNLDFPSTQIECVGL